MFGLSGSDKFSHTWIIGCACAHVIGTLLGTGVPLTNLTMELYRGRLVYLDVCDSGAGYVGSIWKGIVKLGVYESQQHNGSVRVFLLTMEVSRGDSMRRDQERVEERFSL